MKGDQQVEQTKKTFDQQGTAADEQRDRTANPSTLLEIVLRRLAEISERASAKESGKLDLPGDKVGVEPEG